jgi:hypothetical protein
MSLLAFSGHGSRPEFPPSILIPIEISLVSRGRCDGARTPLRSGDAWRLRGGHGRPPSRAQSGPLWGDSRPGTPSWGAPPRRLRAQGSAFGFTRAASCGEHVHFGLGGILKTIDLRREPIPERTCKVHGAWPAMP